MILATDVHYYNGKARAAGIIFKNWLDAEAQSEVTIEIDNVEEYVSGSFYKRELPCLLALIDALRQKPSIIIVDGYVYLGKEKKAGLGKYLYEALDQKIAVIGVAKNSFEASQEEIEVFRRDSNTKPN